MKLLEWPNINMDIKLEEILKYAIENKASDIHLIFGVSPKVRINGELLNIVGYENISGEESEALTLSLLNEEQSELFKKEKELDFWINYLKGFS